MLPAGTVLFSSRAPIGYIAIAKNELCTNQGFKSIIPKQDVCNSDFLYYLLSYYKGDIEAIASGTVKAAEFMGHNNLGLVKENYIADLILVNSNPLDDISILSDNDNVLKVMQDGKIVK